MIHDRRLVFSAPKRTENSPVFVCVSFSGRESSTQVGFTSRRNSDINASYKGLLVRVRARVCVRACMCACVHVSRVLPSVLFTQNSCESRGTVTTSRGCKTVPSGLSLEAPHSQQRHLEKPVEAGGLRGGGDPVRVSLVAARVFQGTQGLPWPSAPLLGICHMI